MRNLIVNISTIVSLFLTPTLGAADSPETQLLFTRLTLDESLVLRVIDAANESASGDELLARLKVDFPGVYFVVAERPLDPKHYPWVAENNMRFRDSGLLQDEVSTFLKVFRAMPEFAAAFYRPGIVTYIGSSGRESILAEKPTIVFRPNVPKGTVVHEMLHYLIYQAREKHLPSLKDESKQQWTLRELRLRHNLNDSAPVGYLFSDLAYSRHDTGEELDVTLTILRHRFKLGLSRADSERQEDLVRLYLKMFGNLLEYNDRTLLKYFERENINDPDLRRLTTSELVIFREAANTLENEFKRTP